MTRIFAISGLIMGALAGSSIGIASSGSASSGSYTLALFLGFIGMLIGIIKTHVDKERHDA